MLNMHLSCHKAHITPVAHFIQILSNMTVHGSNGFTTRLQGRSGINAEVPDILTRSQSGGEVAGTCEGDYFKGKWIFWTVSNPQQEMCILGSPGLHNRNEAEPHPNGKQGCSIILCKRTHSLSMSKNTYIWCSLWQKETDEDLGAPSDTKGSTF